MLSAVTAGSVVGCGGHSGPSATDSGGRSASSGLAALRHVVSVSPHRLGALSPLVVNYDGTLTAATPTPTLTPAVPGRWSRNGTTATFQPAAAYPPDTVIWVREPDPQGHAQTVAHRRTPHGSLLRAEQILARLHYLPLTTTAPEPVGTAAQAAAVYTPPPGQFHWRYGNIPSTLRADWSPGKSGVMLRGAVIAFQHDAGLRMDGSIGHDTWRSLLRADERDAVAGRPYSYVFADLDMPQRLSVWVAGSTVLSSPVNGGVASAPTPLGTFPVYERFTSTTMSGTNPDGSHYSDPGVPWVNYFSGGSAVHGFPRASYGSPQSVGCLELPIPTAERVYNLIGYGTLVTVTGPAEPSPTVASPAAPNSSPNPSKPSSKPTSSRSPRPSHSHATSPTSKSPSPSPSPSKHHH